MSDIQPLSEFQAESLRVQVYESVENLGKAASDFTAGKLKRAITNERSANLILATGASQFSFLESLNKDKSIDWSKITVFHLDEYLGMSDQHPASFRKYLRERILDEVKPAKVYYLEGDAPDIQSVISEYEDLLRTHPVHVACIGIGENGHLAFNDPPVADFNDPKLVKIVELDEQCRQQQFDEGWFDSFDAVSTHALSLTIPAIMGSQSISCVVPDRRKAEAVAGAVQGPISTACPASILRSHPDVTLFLDNEAAALIN
ncbi:glucosamine-6-phosphate deaminase [candidate division KSB1 bacterium]|nr:glucosamine-6-phosphate deaminase [candidate division KSB1 bacterium]